eukprot:255449-Prorocentrum_minimum.AAC.1
MPNVLVSSVCSPAPQMSPWPAARPSPGTWRRSPHTSQSGTPARSLGSPSREAGSIPLTTSKWGLYTIESYTNSGAPRSHAGRGR